MALLLRDREAPPEVAAPPGGEDQQVIVPDFACATCGAAMEAGQDWCLECGSAAPGRLGQRPGWRAALTVVSLTLLLVGGAVVASYAALTGDAEREAARAPAGSGDPIVAQTPPPAPVAATPPAPGAAIPGAAVPGAQAPVVPAPQPGQGTTGPFVRIPGVNTPGQGTQAPAPVTPTPGSTGGGDATPTAPAPPAVRAIDLGARATRTYDPYKRPGAEFGPAGNAADDDAETVWDVTVPADGESLRVGLVVDLGAAYTLSSMKIETPTPGFDVELYGAEGRTVPDDILDRRWEHLTDPKDVAGDRVVDLEGRSDKKQRLVVLWFTQAADAADPRIAIGELSFRGTR